MRKILFAETIIACLLAATVAVQAAPAADSVAAWVGRAAKIGPADSRQTVRLAVYLGLRDEDKLRDLITAQQTKGDPAYGHYLSAAEFHARFAPYPASVAAVERELTRLGFRIGHKPVSGFYIEAYGTVGLVKSAFHVSQDMFAYQGKQLRANVEPPTLTPALAPHVAFIGGLDDTGRLIRPAHIMLGAPRSPALVTDTVIHRDAPPPVAGENPSPYCDSYLGDLDAAVVPQPSPYPATLPWLGCSYTPPQIRTAYGADKLTLDGTGVRVAAVDAFASPTIRFDLNTYSANHGLPKIDKNDFSQIIPVGIYHVKADNPCGPQGWYEEESLDLESIHSMAPGAKIVYVGAEDCNDSLTDVLYDTIDNEIADVITNSWSYGGEPLSAAERYVQNAMFEQAASEGISVMFSSGDDGDLSQNQGFASGSWPATSPWVTGVGGTSLLLSDSAGSKTEYGWGTFRSLFTDPVINGKGTLVKNKGLSTYAFYAGAGGGPSLYQGEPPYQQGVVPAALATRTYTAAGAVIPLNPPKRVTPDVAMDADPYTGFLFGETFTVSVVPVANTGCKSLSSTLEYCEGGIGGTSLASPLFAGVLALVDQARFSHGRPAIGFANPTLYKLQTGAPGSTTTPVLDIQAPPSPAAMLRGYIADLAELRLVTINSVPSSNCAGGVCEGLDDAFNVVTPGYDNVTGVGVPFVPALVAAVGNK